TPFVHATWRGRFFTEGVGWARFARRVAEPPLARAPRGHSPGPLGSTPRSALSCGERAWVRTRGSQDPFRPRDPAWSSLHGGSGMGSLRSPRRGTSARARSARSPPRPARLDPTLRALLRRARVGSNAKFPPPLLSTRPGVVVSSRREWDGLASLAASRNLRSGALRAVTLPARSARPHAPRSPAESARGFEREVPTTSSVHATWRGRLCAGGVGWGRFARRVAEPPLGRAPRGHRPGPLGSTPRFALSSRRARVGPNACLPRPLSSTRPGVVVSSRREWDSNPR